MKLQFSSYVFLSILGSSTWFQNGVYGCPYLDSQQEKGGPVDELLDHTLSSSKITSNIPTRKLIRGRGGDIRSKHGQRRQTPVTIDQAIADAKEAIKTTVLDGKHGTPKLVRLAFHDCVGGMCDGCVDLSNPDNYGLEETIAALTELAETFADTGLTRGDIFVLAGLTAAEVAQTAVKTVDGVSIINQNPVDFEMTWYGRPSCETPTGGPNNAMPSAHLERSAVLDYFNGEFGFNDRETVAILGAHALGKATPPNSGFNGLDGWTTNRILLDTEFYRVLLDSTNNNVDPSFVQEVNENPPRRPFPSEQYFWRRTENTDGQFGPPEHTNDRQFMLNSDMGLVIDTDGQINQETGLASCGISDTGDVCPESPQISIVQEFASDNDLWINEFKAAFQKMTNIGCDADKCNLV